MITAVDVAVHPLAGTARKQRVLVSHATGFHAHCYVELAEYLHAECSVTGLDHRGHGVTEAPADWQVDWQGFGDDTLAVGTDLAPDGNLVGFGHSMGGAALLMAAHRSPGLFSHLVLFEPIVFPPGTAAMPPDERSLAIGAERRRATFDSYEAAIANYRAKPPLALMTPASLRRYVEYGFRPTHASGDGASDTDHRSVTLRCTPMFEAAVFRSAEDIGVWQVLPEIDVPVTVVAGAVDRLGPAAIAKPIAEALPNARYLSLPHLTHLAPFSHPGEVAAIIASLL